jgi:molybdate transport system substrate-binding protein
MRFTRNLGLALWLAALPFTLWAADIKVISSTGMSTMFKQLLPVFEQGSGHKVTVSYDTSNIILRRLQGGETADLVILTAPLIDQLMQQGKVVSGSRVDLARSGIGVAVREGAPRPDISNLENFKALLLQAKSVTYTATGASGIYFAGVTEKMGIGPVIKAKAITPAGGHVAELVAKGEAEVGIQMVSEIKGVPGAVFLGPLPADIQLFTIFSAGMLTGSQAVAPAQALVQFLTSPAAIKVYEASGMER